MSAAGSLAQTTAPGHAQNASSSLAHSAAAAAPIDRHALVTRHNVVVHTLDPNGAMAVGNGDFAFNFDVTGLQSFPEYYAKTMPIGILSDWGWHSFPNPDGYTLDKFPMTAVPKYGRQFIFPSASTSHPTPDAAYLRANPNRFGLGRIGLEMSHADGSPVLITDLKDITQTLDLWAGILTSSFEVDGQSRSRHHHLPPRPRRSRHAHRIAPHRRRPPQTPHRLPLRIRLLRPRLSGLGSPRSPHHQTYPQRRNRGRVRPHPRRHALLRLHSLVAPCISRPNRAASISPIQPFQPDRVHSQLPARRLVDRRPRTCISQSSRHLRRRRSRLARPLAAVLDHRRSHRPLRQL